MSEPWNYEQPLRAGASDEEMEHRVLHLWRHAGIPWPQSSGQAARELVAAETAALREELVRIKEDNDRLRADLDALKPLALLSLGQRVVCSLDDAARGAQALARLTAQPAARSANEQPTGVQ